MIGKNAIRKYSSREYDGFTVSTDIVFVVFSVDVVSVEAAMVSFSI